MSGYVYFVLTAAGYILKLELVRKMVGFYGQVTNSEQLSARKRFNLDKLCYRIQFVRNTDPFSGHVGLPLQIGIICGVPWPLN